MGGMQCAGALPQPVPRKSISNPAALPLQTPLPAMQGEPMQVTSRMPVASPPPPHCAAAMRRLSAAPEGRLPTRSPEATAVGVRTPRAVMSPRLVVHRQHPAVSKIRCALASVDEFSRCARECFQHHRGSSEDDLLRFEDALECAKSLVEELGIGELTDRIFWRCVRRFDTTGDMHLSKEEFAQLCRLLLLARLHELEPTPFCRDMFIGRRRGLPSDHYEAMKVLGQGSFAVVTKVRDKASGAVRVMKTVDREMAMNSGVPFELIMEEMDKLKALDHPAILRLFEYYVDADRLYLITDFLRCGDLLQALVASHLQRSPLAEPWVQGVFVQICEGVSYIHSKGLMHKDLKLDNILLSSADPPQPVVIDVGLAELFPVEDADTFRSEEYAGSVPTVAPEVIRRSFTCKCDVWSLGCCLFGLLCQKPTAFRGPDGGLEVYPYPFSPPEGPQPEEMEAYACRMEQGPPLENFRGGEEARDLLRLMLTPDDQRRPSMPQVLAHSWLRDEGCGAEPRGLSAEKLDCLLNFDSINALEEAVLLDVASQIPLREVRGLAQLFGAMDRERDGALDAGELAAAMEAAGLEADLAGRAAAHFAREGMVEFSRFVAALLPSRRGLLMRHLHAAFRRLDADGDGVLTREDVRSLLREDSSGSCRRATRIFQALSNDGASPVSFEDFSAYFQKLCDPVPRHSRRATARASWLLAEDCG